VGGEVLMLPRHIECRRHSATRTPVSISLELGPDTSREGTDGIRQHPRYKRTLVAGTTTPGRRDNLINRATYMLGGSVDRDGFRRPLAAFVASAGDRARSCPHSQIGRPLQVWQRVARERRGLRHHNVVPPPCSLVLRGCENPEAEVQVDSDVTQRIPFPIHGR
jgi:hypothetical protein